MREETLNGRQCFHSGELNRQFWTTKDVNIYVWCSACPTREASQFIKIKENQIALIKVLLKSNHVFPCSSLLWGYSRSRSPNKSKIFENVKVSPVADKRLACDGRRLKNLISICLQSFQCSISQIWSCHSSSYWFPMIHFVNVFTPKTNICCSFVPR